MEAARASWPSAGLTALSGVALALGFVMLIGRYYAFYHLGGPGAAMGLLLVALPAAALGAAAVALGVRRRALRLGTTRAGASGRGVGAAALLLALEVWRTAGLRSGEAPGPVTSRRSSAPSSVAETVAT